MRFTVILLIALAAPVLTHAATLKVPSQYPKIQAAIDAAFNGDTIRVEPGTYVENIDFKGKAVRVKSEQGPDATTIDGKGSGNPPSGGLAPCLLNRSVVTFDSGEKSNSVLEGFTITNGSGTLSGNYYCGGGIYCMNSSPTITNNRITGNAIVIPPYWSFTSCGGGIHCENSSAMITNNIITGNSAERGSGMFNGENGNPTVSNCTFSDTDGDKMYNSGAFPIVIDCTFTGNGRGMYNYYSAPLVANCTFSQNKHTSSGAGMCNCESYPWVIDCTFSENSGYSGGGMSNVDSNPTVINCSFTNNSSGAYYGSAGGMFNNDSFPILTNCTFSGNTAAEYGGGMYNFDSGPLMNHCLFIGNTAGDRGGGMYNYCSGEATLNNCIFLENSAKNGGGMYNTITHLTLNGCIFDEHSGLLGGGMYNYKSCPHLNNCIFRNNSVLWGGGIYCENSTPFVTNNTFIGNSASRGAGIYCCGFFQMPIKNTIFWDNTATHGSAVFTLDISGSPSVDISYSDVQGGKGAVTIIPGCTLNWGPGNIDANPLFVDSANGDGHLTFPSPCRDTGDDTAVIELYDFEGDPRIAYGTVDMGADEFDTHLYWSGDATPGGNAALNFVGLPGTNPVQLWLGSGIMDPPKTTKYGDWYLDFPLLAGIQNLGAVPSNGVLTLPFTLPVDTPIPLLLPFQSGIGATLTNLCVMKVE